MLQHTIIFRFGETRNFPYILGLNLSIAKYLICHEKQQAEHINKFPYFKDRFSSFIVIFNLS